MINKYDDFIFFWESLVCIVLFFMLLPCRKAACFFELIVFAPAVIFGFFITFKLKYSGIMRFLAIPIFIGILTYLSNFYPPPAHYSALNVFFLSLACLYAASSLSMIIIKTQKPPHQYN